MAGGIGAAESVPGVDCARPQLHSRAGSIANALRRVYSLVNFSLVVGSGGYSIHTIRQRNQTTRVA